MFLGMANFSPLILSALLLTTGTIYAQTFAPIVVYPLSPGSNPIGIAVADVNGDGKPDVLTANTAGSIGVLLGTGLGTLGAITTYTTGAGSGTRGLKVADANGDGKLDVFTANTLANTVGVLLGNGNGTFQSMVSYPASNATIINPRASSLPIDIVVGDVNTDGKLDLLTCNFGNDTVGLLLGTGTGTFASATTYSAGFSGNPQEIALADVNNDGKLDVLTTNPIPNDEVAVLLNTGAGTLQPPITYATTALNGAWGIAVGDLNSDGQPDIALMAGRGTAGVLLGSSTGTFGPLATYPVANSEFYRNSAMSDINLDGKPDLITTDTTSLFVVTGTGTGGFGTARSFALDNGNRLGNIAVADINMDGRPDIVVANYHASSVSILLSTTPLPTHAALPGASVTLAPNPASDYATLTLASLPATIAQVQATLLDATGRAVGQQALAASQGAARAEVPTAGLAPGFYVVRLDALDARGQSTGSLPVQHLSVR